MGKEASRTVVAAAARVAVRQSDGGSRGHGPYHGAQGKEKSLARLGTLGSLSVLCREPRHAPSSLLRVLFDALFRAGPE